eukprot:gene9145-10729_t
MKQLVFVAALIAVASAIISVDVNTQNLVDEVGRVRIFHGVNVVYKIFPWHPSTDGFDPVTSLVAEDIANLQSWGFNAVRFGAMWPGVEPERGVFNQTYLDVIKGMVDELGNAGIYTIIDFHQDLINRRFCGEGIPDWAVVVPDTLDFPMPAVGLKKYPVDNTTLYPDLETCLSKEFATYYFSDQVGQAFQSLYDNAEGIQDEFIKYWQALATTFVDTDSVLAYEIINEPWAGNIYKNPALLVELGHTDRVNLMPLYEAVNAGIREIDDQRAIMFEKNLVDVYDSAFPAGTPGGVAFNNRQILSYHVYCGSSGPGPRHIGLCDDEDLIFISGAMKDLKRLGGGGFMTEFGAVGNVTNAYEMLEAMTTQADDHLQSWAYWQFKYYNDLTTSGSSESFYLADGTLDIVKVKTLSRTYAQATAGLPIKMVFVAETSEFVFTYLINTNIVEPTIIYLNEALYYSNGYTATIVQGDAVITSPSTNILNVVPSSTTVNGSTVTIHIVKK